MGEARARKKGNPSPPMDMPNFIQRTPGAAGLTLLTQNAWPVVLGALTGDAVATSAQWARPGLIAVMSGAILQLLIALLRNLFTERRDVLNTLRDMLKEQREAVHTVEVSARRIRHDMANRTHAAEMQLALLARGVPFDQLPHVKPLYDLEAEQVDEDIHRTATRSSDDRRRDR